jgi:uncharacterized protein
MTASTVLELWRYPVKSLAGEQLEQAAVGPLGIAGDRHWALRNVETGKILSAKQPRYGSKLLACSSRYVEMPTSASEGVAEIVIGDQTLLSTDAVAVSRSFSSFLGFAVQFESASGGDDVYESYWPEIDGLALSDITTDFPIAMFTDKGTFGDLAALHLLTTASLDHLRSLIPNSIIEVGRFRPNVVVQTNGEGFVENDWAGKTANIGGAIVAFGLNAPRCVMTTLEQPGLPADRAVLATLAKHNRISFEGFGNFACLGMYAEVSASGTIAIGDALSLNAS